MFVIGNQSRFNSMNIKSTILYLTFLFSVCYTSTAQVEYPKNYFRSPVDIPILLAGNFGEIRSGHFHAGLDIKTEGVEGKNIYATAEGYISRIKIAHGGYGKVLYINHPNGYTTAYAHLKSFSPKIEKIVKSAQYKEESYEIEIFPAASELPVEKGEIIALSGNSGGSGGPHLHFEIRETKTEVPINPILFGFDIKDNTKPTIKKLGIYPTLGGTINDSKENLLIPTKSTGNGNYELTTKTLNAQGKIGIGLEVLDKLDGSNNRCGVYSIELMVDSTPIYCHDMERIGFYETRYINSHVCYEDWKKSDSRIQRSFIQPNNKLGVYNCQKQGYVFDFNDTLKHHFTYIVRDSHLNTSYLEFDIQSIGSPTSSQVDSTLLNAKNYFSFNKTNNFETPEVKVELPSNILYDDILFSYKKTEPIGRAITPIHHIHDIYTPLHSYLKLAIKIDSLPIADQNKALIVALDENLSFLAAEGGIYSDGWISVKTRSFGPYTVMLDTIAPTIKPFNVVNGRNMTNKEGLMLTITDDLSGIESYRGSIDGKWVLFEYDYKKDRLTYYFDENKIEKNTKHELIMEVKDKKDNISKYKVSFYW